MFSNHKNNFSAESCGVIIQMLFSVSPFQGSEIFAYKKRGPTSPPIIYQAFGLSIKFLTTNFSNRHVPEE